MNIANSDPRKRFPALCLACIASLLAGCLLLMFEPPEWLERGELVAAMALALAYGFRFFALPECFRSRPVRGAACVALGVFCPFIPPGFVAAAALIGYGTREMWTVACELAEAEEGEPAATPPSPGEGEPAPGPPRQPGPTSVRSLATLGRGPASDASGGRRP